ncbi:MAG: glycosyltransferase family 39 protein [Myxococcota bacterium]
MSPRRLTRSEWWVGASLFIGYVMILVWTSSDLAMSRDESFYAQAAEYYGRWLAKLFSDPSFALTQASIDDAWRYNWEHPAWMKLMFAWSWLAHETLGLFSSASLAIRFPGMVTAGLLLWLIFAWGTVVLGARGALFASLAFATMPRVFYHAHLAAFDVAIAFLVTLTAYTYWRSLTDRRWAPLVGLAFGLALATKHNSWMLPAIFAIHYAWVRAQDARHARSLRPSMWWLPAMLGLGPIVFFATWPWVWFDSWNRIGAYVRFHLQHVHYTYEYFGVSYFEPPLPVSVPFVMTLFTVPITVVALAIIGLASRRRELAPNWRPGPDGSQDTRVEVLWLGCLLAPLVAIALPSTPIFGGTKHWITAYPFLALWSGRGLISLIGNTGNLANALPGLRRVVFFCLCLAPGVTQAAHSHPFGLSHYGPVAGGTPGAADLGMNRQFWGFTTGSLASWLTERLPQGGSVWTGDTTWGAWKMMQADGLLPDNIVPARSMAQADLILVHHEAHFREVDYQAWVSSGSPQPVHVLTYDGVPIISVYENP